MPLEMKYFILKPKAKAFTDPFATAAQSAMFTFADSIEETDYELAEELRSWARKEVAAQHRMTEKEQHPASTAQKQNPEKIDS